jgi:hypothetical protein
MPVILKIQCPDCGETFRQPMGDAMPKFCPLCGSYVGGDPDFVPTQANIGTIKGKIGDITYRQLEADSAARAEAAGNPAMKITDMNETPREGDIAAKPVKNTVTQYMDAAKQAGAPEMAGGFTPNVAGLAAAAQSGPERRNGSYALQAIQGGSMGGGPPRLPLPPGQGFGGGR